MAKLPTLIETMNIFVHQEPPAIRYSPRSLREAGLFSAGAGGRGSPHMTARDAAYLLLALTVATEPAKYVSTVSTLRMLRREESPQIPDWARPDLDAVLEATTFGDAIVALLDNAHHLGILNPVTQILERGAGQEGDRRIECKVTVTKQFELFKATVAMENFGPGPSRTEVHFVGMAGPDADRIWPGVTSTQIFDPAPFIALKRTLAPTAPWVFQA